MEIRANRAEARNIVHQAAHTVDDPIARAFHELLKDPSRKGVVARCEWDVNGAKVKVLVICSLMGD
jgi:hypothetical protein